MAGAVTLWGALGKAAGAHSFCKSSTAVPTKGMRACCQDDDAGACEVSGLEVLKGLEVLEVFWRRDWAALSSCCERGAARVFSTAWRTA